MPISLDRRTRHEADARQLTPAMFFAEEFPGLVASHGPLVARGIEALGARPLAIEVGDGSWSFTSDGETLVRREGIVDDALVVTLDEDAFSRWAQNLLSFNGMGVARELRSRNGSPRDVSIWDSLSLTLLEGWPIVDDDIEFLDRDGAKLDFGRIFTPDDDPVDVAHFLREAGFLHLRGWLDPEDMPAISAEIDRALPLYKEGDGRSWWAVLEDGTRTCVRLQQFVEHSPTTAAILSSDRWDQLRRTLAADDELVQGRPGNKVIEALVKPVGVVAGASDVSFHRDCHLGRHAYGCSGRDVGISVTGSGEANGQLRVVAGSHRVVIPVEIAKTDPYLPVVAVPTEAGDLTVHLSCTLHESTPPPREERRVMYTPFKLAPRPGEPAEGGRNVGDLRDRVSRILVDEATRTTST